MRGLRSFALDADLLWLVWVHALSLALRTIYPAARELYQYVK